MSSSGSLHVHGSDGSRDDDADDLDGYSHSSWRLFSEVDSIVDKTQPPCKLAGVKTDLAETRGCQSKLRPKLRHLYSELSYNVFICILANLRTRSPAKLATTARAATKCHTSSRSRSKHISDIDKISLVIFRK